MEIDFQKMNDTEPNNRNESKALLLLVMRGHLKNKIQFRQGLDGTRHLRVGYWEPITTKDLNYVQEHSNIKLDEVRIFDDDCGHKYWYSII